MYGSFAHFYWTKDENLKVRDIDFYIKEKDYPILIKILNENKIYNKYNSEWHVMSVKDRKLTLEFDSIDFWYKKDKGGPIKKDFHNINFYGIKTKVLGIKGLEKLYIAALKRTKDNKVKISKKIKHLELFLGRKLS